MRLLIATTHAAVVGGGETYLRAALPLLGAAGFEVGVLTESGPATPGAGILEHCPDVRTWVAGGRSETVRSVEDWRPDVVCNHGLADPRLERALARQFPTVLFAHNYHGTCVSGTKCFGRPAAEPCRRTLGAGCLVRYFPRRCGGRSPVQMLRLYRTQVRRRAVVPRYRSVVVFSRHMAAEHRRHGVAGDRLHLVPLFPPGAARDPAPPAPRPRSDRVLFVGRLTRVKGAAALPAVLARAAADLGRRLTLVVAGDGPERPEVEAEARRHAVPAEFLGWVDADRRAAEMRAADTLAVPGVWPEPFGLVGIEAGCVGLPAVGYATGGITDWLTPGVTGEAAPGDNPDPAALAAAVVRALADESHRHRLATGAWEMARRYTPEAHLGGLLPVLSAAARR